MRERVRDQDGRGRGREGRLASRRHPLLVTFGASSAFVLLGAACGGGSSSTSAKSTSTTAPAAAGNQAPAASSHGTPAQVMTALTEYHIALSQQSFSPGAYSFVATNSGKVTHALEIDGPGVEDQKTTLLQPGQSANLAVNLQKGTYQVYCPVGAHKGLGMATTITVGA